MILFNNVCNEQETKTKFKKILLSKALNAREPERLIMRKREGRKIIKNERERERERRERKRLLEHEWQRERDSEKEER